MISCLGPADPALYSLVMYGASSDIPNEIRSVTYSVSIYSRDQGSKGVTRYMGIAYSDQVGEVSSAPEVSQLVCVEPHERGREGMPRREDRAYNVRPRHLCKVTRANIPCSMLRLIM